MEQEGSQTGRMVNHQPVFQQIPTTSKEADPIKLAFWFGRGLNKSWITQQMWLDYYDSVRHRQHEGHRAIQQACADYIKSLIKSS